MPRKKMDSPDAAEDRNPSEKKETPAKTPTARKRTKKPNTADSKTTKGRSADYVVVGIGASAGGLEALTQMLPALPFDQNIAYVVAQHLDPKHRSIMPSLLNRHTSMEVVEIKTQHPIEPNKIYIALSARDVTVKNGVLKLSKPISTVGPKPSVNMFLSTLAEDLGERAVGIILSGTGSDGAHGIRAIKAEGGITIVQTPETAKYDGMPKAAIDTGHVDLVLAPEKIGPELSLVLNSAPQARRKAAGSQPPADAFGHILHRLLLRTGSDFTAYKPTTIQRRIARRMAIRKFLDVEDYVSLLERSAEEVDALYKDILISVTSFFRDAEAFESLQTELPQLIESKRPGESIRIWVPGCATGEEVYSIAILISEFLDKQNETYHVQIFGTDVDLEAIEKARRGIYPETSLVNLDNKLIKKYFRREDNVFQVAKQLREWIVFAKQDLIKDPPFSHLDIISCRNLLIYLNTEIQQKLIHLFHYSLSPGGYLMLGKSESVGKFTDLFRQVQKKWKIYQRRGGEGVATSAFGPPRIPVLRDLRPLRNREKVFSPKETTHQALAEVYGARAVLVDEHMEIVYVHGDLSPFLGLREGEPGHTILDMAAPDLRVNLQALIHKSRRENAPQVSRLLKVKSNGHTKRVNLRVSPVPVAGATGDYSLVILEEIEVDPARAEELSADDEKTLERINELEQELAATREHLQTTVEELETSNEELQSLNEELQSANEELQSSNEELETSNEELQATNEELNTVNDELQVKSNELSLAYDDLENITKRVGIAMVVVDKDLRVTRYTPPATAIFNLMAGDIGSVLTAVAAHVDIPNLREMLTTVIRNKETISKELIAGNTIYQVRIFPYYDHADKVAGAILGFYDKTEVHRKEQAFIALAENAPDIIARFDRDFQHLFVNKQVERITGRKRNEFIGKTNRQLGMPEENCDLWDRVLAEVFESGKPSKVEFEFESVDGLQYFEARYAPETTPDGKVSSVVTVTRNITAQKQTEKAFALEAEISHNMAELSRTLLREDVLDTVAELILNVAQRLTHSDCGYVGYIDSDTQKLVIPVMTRDVWTACMKPGSNVPFDECEGLWGWVLQNKEPILSNAPENDERNNVNPERQLPVHRFLSVPAVINDELVGQISLANSENNYTEKDLEIVQRLANLYAIALQRGQVARELNDAKVTAEEASQTKNQFLATMSHEIRTPMNAIIGFTDLLEKTKLDQQQKEYLGIVRNSADQLLGLINEILDLAKIEAGRMELDSETFDLRAALKNMLATLSLRAREEGVSLESHVDPEVPDALWGDPRCLRQVILNLINNAIKFTDDGEIMFSVKVEERTESDVLLCFAVTDTGIGIPPEKQKAIFEPFYQLREADGTHPYGGTGLGLTICQNLVHLMGGKFEVQSTPGQGSTFSFTVRLKVADLGSVNLPKLDSQKPGPELSTGSPDSHPRYRILLAEDNRVNQKLIMTLLEKNGYEAILAKNGQEAVEMAGNQAFDLVLMDVEMPVMDGFEATRIIRGKDNQNSRTPVVALTAHAMKGDEKTVPGVRHGWLRYQTRGFRRIEQNHLESDSKLRKDQRPGAGIGSNSRLSGTKFHKIVSSHNAGKALFLKPYAP